METTFYVDPLGLKRERNIIPRTNNRVIHLDAISEGRWIMRYFNKLTEEYSGGCRVFEDTSEAVDFLKFYRFIK